MKAISIVYPNGSRIALGEKRIEVRSWLPREGFSEDLLVIENSVYLMAEGDTDPNGVPVALVKIKRVRSYLEADIPDACASRWEPGYYSWELTDVRPVNSKTTLPAARGIYEVDFNPAELKA